MCEEAWTFVVRCTVVAAVLAVVGCTGHGPVSGIEARANLKSAYTAEMAYLQEKDRFSTDIDALGFAPERRNRYAYFFAEPAILEDRSAAGPSPATTGRNGIGVDVFRFGGAARILSYRASACPLTVQRPGGLPPLKLGITGTPPNEAVVIAAAGNGDADPMLDCWSISNVDRLDARGRLIPKGEPYREQDDRDIPLWQRLLER